MPIQFTNNAVSILPNAIESTDTEFDVGAGDGALFPVLGAQDYFFATIVDTFNNLEIVKVTARVGDTFTVVRAQEGTLAIPYAPLCRIELRITAQSIRDLIDESVSALLL